MPSEKWLVAKAFLYKTLPSERVTTIILGFKLVSKGILKHYTFFLAKSIMRIAGISVISSINYLF
jgi:hypothetical protein